LPKASVPDLNPSSPHFVAAESIVKPLLLIGAGGSTLIEFGGA
jgi:hypothetical protein